MKIKENGEIEKEYEVVFPYQNGQNNVWEKVVSPNTEIWNK